MQKRTVVALFALCVTFSLAADQKPPVFYFGAQRLFVGMPKSEAVVLLSKCCKLSPPADSGTEKLSAETGKMLGHFIISKENDQQGQIIGTIYFEGGKVVRITRPMDADKFDPVSDDVVAFARAFERGFSTEISTSPAIVYVSARHDRATNADAEVLSLSFPNGRTVELQVVTLDTPSESTGKRDSVGLDEVLEAPRR
jgi:hypothetical protein